MLIYFVFCSLNRTFAIENKKVMKQEGGEEMLNKLIIENLGKIHI